MKVELPLLGNEEALVSRLAATHRQGRRVVFLVGSPLVAPTRPGISGVPGVAEMLEQVRSALKGEVEMLELKGPGAYQHAFESFLNYRGLPEVNRLVRWAVLSAYCGQEGDLVRRAADGDPEACRLLERQVDAWYLAPGVAALGELIATFPKTFGHTLLTTNFDPLIEVSVQKAGGQCWRTTLHMDGSLETSEAEGCRVVHVHGSWRGSSDTLHTPLQLCQERPQLQASLRRLFESSVLVVVAYGGWQDVFTRTLTRVVADVGASPEVLWTFYPAGQDQILTHAAALLPSLRTGIERGTVTLFAGIDCHSFFPRLCWRLLGKVEEETKASPLSRRSTFVIDPPGAGTSEGASRQAAQDVYAPTLWLGLLSLVLLLLWIFRHFATAETNLAPAAGVPVGLVIVYWTLQSIAKATNAKWLSAFLDRMLGKFFSNRRAAWWLGSLCVLLGILLAGTSSIHLIRQEDTEVEGPLRIAIESSSSPPARAQLMAGSPIARKRFWFQGWQTLSVQILEPAGRRPSEVELGWGGSIRLVVPTDFVPNDLHLLCVVPGRSLWPRLPDLVQGSSNYTLEISVEGLPQSVVPLELRPVFIGVSQEELRNNMDGEEHRISEQCQEAAGVSEGSREMQRVPWFVDKVELQGGMSLEFRVFGRGRPVPVAPQSYTVPFETGVRNIVLETIQ